MELRTSVVLLSRIETRASLPVGMMVRSKLELKVLPSSGGTINVYINNELSETISSTSLDTEVVNIEI